MVVSARGHKTDELIELANGVSATPSAREMDMLLATGEQESVALVAMAIQDLGEPAVSLTGGQIGIVTDARTPRPASKDRHEADSPRARRGKHCRRRRLSGHRQRPQYHHAGPRRQRHDGHGARRRPAGRRVRESTPTSKGSSPPIRVCSSRPAKPIGSPTTKCSSWPAWARG